MLLRSSLILVGARAFSDLLQLLLYVAIVRHFTEQDVGDYSFAFAISMVLGMAVGLGARSLITREVANAPELAAVFPVNLLVLHGGLSLLVGAGLAFWAQLADFSTSLTAMCLLAFGAAGLTTVGYGTVAVVDASGRVERGARAELLGKACTVLLGFTLLLAGFELVFVMAAQVAGALCYMTLAMRSAARTYGALAWNVDWALITRTVRSALPFAGAALLTGLYARADIIMLHRIAGPEETAFYAVAYRVIETTLVIASMTGIAMFPQLAAGGVEGTSARRQLFCTAVRWLSILGGLVAIVLVVAGDRLATLVFGLDFASSGDLLRAMAVLVIISYVKEPFWRLLLSQRREMLQIRIQAAAVALNVGLNLMFIPRYGALGAVVASLVSQTLMLLGFALAILKAGWINFVRIAGWFAAMILASLAGLFLRHVVDPILAGAASVFLLAVLMVLFNVVQLEELRALIGNLRTRGTPTPTPVAGHDGKER